MLKLEQRQSAGRERVVAAGPELKNTLIAIVICIVAPLPLYYGIHYLPGGLGLFFNILIPNFLKLYYFLLSITLASAPFQLKKSIRWIKAWKNLEDRRQRAAQAAIPDAAAKYKYTQTPLPFSLTIPSLKKRVMLRSRLIGLVSLFLVMLGPVYIGWTSNFAAGIPHGITTLFSFFFSFAVDIALCLLVLISNVIEWINFFRKRSTPNHWLTATEDGLIEQEGKATRFIPWSEARLFALVKSKDVDGGKGIDYTYELASATKLIRWSTQSINFIQRPQSGAIQDDADIQSYQQHLQTLLMVIAARTGLPFYDLREA